MLNQENLTPEQVRMLAPHFDAKMIIEHFITFDELATFKQHLFAVFTFYAINEKRSKQFKTTAAAYFHFLNDLITAIEYWQKIHKKNFTTCTREDLHKFMGWSQLIEIV